MPGTTARDRFAAEQLADASRRWERRRAGVGSLVLVDPELAPDSPLLPQLRAVGVHAEVHDEYLTALVRLGARAPDVVVLSAATPAPDLARVVSVVRTELAVPVLLAFGSEETARIGPAVAAGALPAVRRPYRFVDVLRAIQPHWPRHPQCGERLTVGDLEIDVDGYDAHLGRVAVDLTTVEFDVLTVLARRADHVVLREALACRFWPRSQDPDGALVATVARVRRKLARVGAGEAIHTVRGVGYRLESAGLRLGTPSPRDPES